METEENSNPVPHQLGNGRVGCGPKQMHKHTSPYIAPSLPHDIGSKNEPQQNAMTDLDSVECMENIANAQVHMAETFVNTQQSGVRNVSVAQQPNNKNISQKYSTQTQHSDAFPVCHTSQLAKHDQKIASTVAVRRLFLYMFGRIGITALIVRLVFNKMVTTVDIFL